MFQKSSNEMTDYNISYTNTITLFQKFKQKLDLDFVIVETPNQERGDADNVWKAIKERLLRLGPNLLLTAQQSCHYSFPTRVGREFSLQNSTNNNNKR